MNRIEKIAKEMANRFDVVDFNDEKELDERSFQDVKNDIFTEVCGFSHLPSESLLCSSNEDFEEDSIGEWSEARLNKAARTMQTIYDRALEIANEQLKSA